MQLEWIPADASITEAAEKMKSSNVGLLLVADDHRLLGVVTDRDIVIRAVAEGKCPGRTSAREIMSDPVVCIDGGAGIEEAAKLMIEKRVRRLVVTSAERPVGVLSLDDLAFATHGDSTAGGVLEEIARGPQGAALFRTV